MENKYKQIEILELGLALPIKIRAIMEDGTSKEFTATDEFNDNECWHIVRSFAEQEGYDSVYKFWGNSDKTVLRASVVDHNKKEEVSDEKEETGDNKEEASEEKKETGDNKVLSEEIGKASDDASDEEKTGENKKEQGREKTKRRGLKITAVVVAALVGLGGVTYTLVDIFKKNNNNKGDSKPKAPILTMIPTGSSANTEYEDRMEDINQRQEEIQQGLEAIGDNTAESEEAFRKYLDDQIAMAYYNMEEISRYLNGGELKGDVYYPNFCNPYAENTYDLAAVSHFNTLRNNIVYYAYEANDKNSLQQELAYFMREYIGFVFCNQPLKTTVNDQEISYYFSDLQPVSQNNIMDIGMGILTVNHDFSISFNNNNYGRMRAIEESAELKQAIYEKLQNEQSFTK